MAERGQRRKVLILLHQAHSTPGRVGRQLQALGFDLDIRRASLGEFAAGSPRPARRRRRVRRPDERERRRRVDQTGNRLAFGSARGGQALSRPLPGRPIARAPTGRACFFASRPTRRGGLLSSACRRPKPIGFARRRFRALSINGISTASICPPAPNCWPTASEIFPIRPIDTAATRSRCSSIPRSPTR